jgi:Ca2+-binding RTX toxin-like protein
MVRALPWLAFALAFLFPHDAAAGCYPWCAASSDLAPRWSADGTRLAYSSGPAGIILHTVVAAPDAKTGRVAIPAIAAPQQLSADFRRYAAYTGDGAGGLNVSVAEVGQASRVIAPASSAWPRIDPVWSPDATRIAFTGATGGVAIAAVDGSAIDTVLSGPADSVTWSPDGTRLAVAIGGAAAALWIVRADGAGARLVYSSGASVAAAWSPDGATLAAVSAPTLDGSWSTLSLVSSDGSVRALGIVEATRVGYRLVAPSWAPGSERLAYATPSGLTVFELGSGAALAIAQGSAPAWSPDGNTIAYTDSGPCLDRSGIAAVAPDGSQWRKLTNDCRIFGSDGADTIIGTDNVDVIYAEGGDDRIDAGGSADTIYGGPGRDVIVGGAGVDTLYGGPGDDTLEGNVIYGGSGRDRLRVIGDWPAFAYAVDGERDVISCGRSRKDVVRADRIDRVGRSCERVSRY